MVTKKRELSEAGKRYRKNFENSEFGKRQINNREFDENLKKEHKRKKRLEFLDSIFVLGGAVALVLILIAGSIFCIFMVHQCMNDNSGNNTTQLTEKQKRDAEYGKKLKDEADKMK